MAEPSRRRALDLLLQHTFSGTTDPQIAGCDSDEEPCTCGRPVSDWTSHHVDVLAVAGLLVDPGVDQSASWVLGRVREALGTPNGRAVSVHAAEVRAERDQLIQQFHDMRGIAVERQRQIDAALAWLQDADGMELTRVSIEALRAKLKRAEPDVTPPEPSGRITNNGPVMPFTDNDHQEPSNA
ncbi:hypothetical protein VA596_41520 [Amycolatopsis sp., V23-08]|uniref:Uncharacterized protein n=1 Tax=Amycolatopsis heterodermiae TaxID=3110235 RepID=A0ABU5RLQ9_9PSEU|nr:hypothetical protein [Amycolatopsis sp., V23-08]MEA5366066.1 hypothetical protein [Amycolatopsis sp., V23-08]